MIQHEDARWNVDVEVAQSSVARHLVKRRAPPSLGWRTFLHNHAPDIAATDLFVVPTAGFGLLYAFVIVRLDRRELVWINARYYNDIGTHRSLDKDAPVTRQIQRIGSIKSYAMLGGLHHHYIRV